MSTTFANNKQGAISMICGCGFPLYEQATSIQWTSSNNEKYVIHNVPVLQCLHDGCNERFFSGDVELSLAILADRMEQGLLPHEIQFENML